MLHERKSRLMLAARLTGKTAAETISVMLAVLDAREKYPDSLLADLYDPLTMPPDLLRAHRKLDGAIDAIDAIDAAYSKKKFLGDADRVAFLFELYQKLTSPLDAKSSPKRKPTRRQSMVSEP